MLGSCDVAARLPARDLESAGTASGDHTQMGWEVDDIDAMVTHLWERGVVFEEVEVPGLRTVDGIAEGNHPSVGGVGERAAWFRDSEGNLIGLPQPCGVPAWLVAAPARRSCQSDAGDPVGEPSEHPCEVRSDR